MNKLMLESAKLAAKQKGKAIINKEKAVASKAAKKVKRKK